MNDRSVISVSLLAGHRGALIQRRTGSGMNTIAPTAPHLPTLDLKPSWHNRAGRVDRAACLALPLKMIRRRAIMRTVRRNPKKKPGLEAVGEVTVSRLHLEHSAKRARPRALQGDYRSPKANAMRTTLRPIDDRQRKHVRTVKPAANPNHGAAATKAMPGDMPNATVSSAWSQMIRIERWRLHERLSQHFLICPTCERRAIKLFMVIAHRDEVRDAALAEGWINLMEARSRAARKPIPADLMELRAKLIDRYGLLFTARRLCCRRCLGVRYGETKRWVC